MPPRRRTPAQNAEIYRRRRERAQAQGRTFYQKRAELTPGHPIDAVRNPIRWAAYIRRHPRSVQVAAGSPAGLRVMLAQAVVAREQVRLPVFACPPPGLGVEGRPNSVGRTLEDVGVYVEEGDLLPDDFENEEF